MGSGGAGSADDPLRAGIGAAIGDVLGDAPEEQERLLKDAAEIAPVIRHGQPPQVGAVDGDGAAGGIEEPADEIGERRLP